jgi:hypothetical protein
MRGGEPGDGHRPRRQRALPEDQLHGEEDETPDTSVNGNGPVAAVPRERQDPTQLIRGGGESRRPHPQALQFLIALEGLSMNRVFKSCALILPLVALCVVPVMADVKTRDRTQVKFEGMLGRMMGMFGGKAARDGIVTTHAVKGDRKVEMTGDTHGRIVDLQEEKIYQLDLKKKEYEVITFDEMRRQLREAREKAERETPKEEKPQGDQAKPEREVEFDFDVKETGQTKPIAGHDTREVVMTLTMREKGKTLDDGGGLVLTSTSWMAPTIAAMKEFADFEMRYWKAIAPEGSGLSAEQMAALMAIYPMLGKAMERLKSEGTKLEGTPLATIVTFEAVKSKAALEEEQKQGSGGGLGGMLARRVMKKESKPRTLVFTSNHETLEVATTVPASDLELPAGFKQKK